MRDATNTSSSSLRRKLRVPIAIAVTLAIALAVVAVNGGGSTSNSAPAVVTLDDALKAFSGGVQQYLDLGANFKGESVDDNHKDWIDIRDMAWAVTNEKATPRSAVFGDLTVTKGLDSASPKIMVAVAGATPFPIVTIDAEARSADQPIIASIVLKNVFLTSFEQGATEEFSEKVSMKYGEITLTYRQQLPTGGVSPIIGCWNLTTKAACPTP